MRRPANSCAEPGKVLLRTKFVPCVWARTPKTSLLNGHCQAQEVRNLFAVDCGVFATYPEKEPLLTVVALACRTAQHMVEQVRKAER